MTTQIASIVQKQIVPLSLLVLLGGTGLNWLTVAVVNPQTALANTARVDVSLKSQADETYENFLRRAESVARAAAQGGFDGDILVTEVAVTIVGEHNGAIAPILLLSVSRQNWKNRPDPQYWAKYFPTSQLLLNFEAPPPQPSAAPVPTPTPTPTPTFTPPTNTPPIPEPNREPPLPSNR